MPSAIFLDDSPERCRAARREKLSTVETAQACIDALKAGPCGILYLDHDLGGEVYVDSNREDCGMEVVRWMVTSRPSVDAVVVHTLNHHAAAAMVDSLRDAGYHVARIPFTQLLAMWNESRAAGEEG